jgi:hypothetical protein
MIRRAHIASLVGLAGVLGACVGDRDTAAPPSSCGAVAMCPSGSTCVANQCISELPSGGLLYAAEAYAPSGRADILARTEIPNLDVGAPGGHVDVMFSRFISYSGRVLLHASDQASAAARVVFHRPSRIPGAPDYEVSATAMPGAAAGEAAFTVLLPPNLPGETYDISIYPDDGTLFTVADGTLPPSALAPPVTLTRQTIQAEPATPVALTGDAAGLRALTGTVVDALGHPMAGMIVRAYVNDTSVPPKRTLVSSTGTTDASGLFQIFVPVDKTSSFDLDVVPGANIVAPTLTRTKPLVTNATNQNLSTALQVATIGYPFYPDPVGFDLPVDYKDAAGGRAPAAGARILFTTTIASQVPSDTVHYDVEAAVDSTGQAHVKLLPGDTANRSYTVTVLPPQSAKNQSLWDRTVEVGAAAGVLQALVLLARVQISGVVLDAQGKPAENVTVRPRVSADNFSPKELERLGALNLNEATTMANGSFTMYLDPTLLDRSVSYDFDVVPAGGSALPQWSFGAFGVDPGGGATAVTLDPFQLPTAAVASGMVTDQEKHAVATAEVHIYAKTATETTWKLRTVAKADDSGNITLVLPSTP